MVHALTISDSGRVEARDVALPLTSMSAWLKVVGQVGWARYRRG